MNRLLESKGYQLLGWVRSANEAVSVRLDRLLSGVIRLMPDRRRGQAPGLDGAEEKGDKPRVGAILDDFSVAALSPEWELASFGPDEAIEELARERPELLFVEAAWRGNQGSWSGRVDSNLRQWGRELERVVAWCREQGIPTAFWGKDDPVHFERFLKSAGLFDSVFTTDADCLPLYRKRLGHSRVFPLLFAAQPAIHHPVSDEPRSLPVCFAGSYWHDRYPQRRRDAEMLLGPAMELGLHIFDRNHGKTGLNALKWRFPERFRPAIQGSLAYDEMLRAYKRYRVFLNLNAVPDSSTMFPRRVLELMASGTPVVSAYARGIEEALGEDTVLFTASPEETREHLHRLLDDELFWARRSALGVRRVMQAHTWADRSREISMRLGLGWKPPGEPRIAVLVRVGTVQDIQRLSEAVERQTRKPDVVMVLSGADLKKAEFVPLENRLGRIPITVTPEQIATERLLKTLGERADLVACWRTGCGYGAGYLQDACLALRYSDAALFGKHTHYQKRPKGGVELHDAGQEYRRVDQVPAATAVARVSGLSGDLLSRMLTSATLECGPNGCLSLDRFNFLAGGGGEDLDEVEN